MRFIQVQENVFDFCASVCWSLPSCAMLPAEKHRIRYSTGSKPRKANKVSIGLGVAAQVPRRAQPNGTDRQQYRLRARQAAK